MTAYDLASRYIGIKEVPGVASHPLIIFAHSLTTLAATSDDVPWCSSFANLVAWTLNLPRSKSAAARSWLEVGTVIPFKEAMPGYDVAILASTPFRREADGKPHPDNPPDATVLDAPGHVGFFSAVEGPKIWIVGGNQSNQVSLAPFDQARLLGIRRLK